MKEQKLFSVGVNSKNCWLCFLWTWFAGSRNCYGTSTKGELLRQCHAMGNLRCLPGWLWETGKGIFFSPHVLSSFMKMIFTYDKVLLQSCTQHNRPWKTFLHLQSWGAHASFCPREYWRPCTTFTRMFKIWYRTGLQFAKPHASSQLKQEAVLKATAVRSPLQRW